MSTFFSLLFFGIILFFQNMAFTWSSRSRNSGDPSYHRKAAWCSNGVYWVCNALLTRYLIEWQHKPWLLAASFVVYVIATTEGSVLMMRQLIKRESGKRLVGAR